MGVRGNGVPPLKEQHKDNAVEVLKNQDAKETLKRQEAQNKVMEQREMDAMRGRDYE